MWVENLHRLAQRPHAQRTFFGWQVNSVVQADSMLVTDRASMLDDLCAGSQFKQVREAILRHQ